MAMNNTDFKIALTVRKINYLYIVNKGGEYNLHERTQ